jgi:hypothetical protein
MWALVKDEVAMKTRTGIQSKKFMLTVMWTLHGFHVIDRLPTGAKSNSTHYTTNGLEPFHQTFFPQGRNSHGKRLVVRVDNCSFYKSVTTEWFMKTRDMVSTAYPSYSPDLAPGNFC